MTNWSNARVCSNARVDRRMVLLAGLMIVAVALVMVDPNALCLLPALALAVPLLMRRYPGEKILAGLSGAGSSRWGRPRSLKPHAWLPASIVPRGGLLLARSLAVRPPPLAGGAAS